jgi:hypothetical protein
MTFVSPNRTLFGRVYINRSARIVIRGVGLIDDGPDEFHHGLVRVNRDEVWGYADPSGRIVVPVKYSCAINSEDISPLVCVGCRTEQPGEYQACLYSYWFHTDSCGHLTPSHAPWAAAQLSIDRLYTHDPDESDFYRHPKLSWGHPTCRYDCRQRELPGIHGGGGRPGSAAHAPAVFRMVSEKEQPQTRTSLAHGDAGQQE